MNPFRLLFLLFILVPLVEIYLLMQVGSVIGAFSTILLVVATAIIGVTLLRAQGLSTLMDAQRSMAGGEIPALQLMEGAALLVSGALLLTPGFVTDFIGFLGLIPTTRKMLIRGFLARSNSVNFQYGETSSSTERRDGVTIDGEFHEKGDPWLK